MSSGGSNAQPKKSREKPDGPVRALVITGALVVLILGSAAGLSYWIKSSEPTAQREAATRKSAALVETITIHRGTHRPLVSVLGSVQPARDVILSPRVSGEIIGVEEVFTPGGIVKAGDPLLKIDPVDYQQSLVMLQSELKQVQTELAIEEGQQRVAQMEFDLLGENIDPANRSLVLREPQIEALRARIEAAQAAVDRARLDLDRTEIAAPFDAQILERFVDLGSQVTPGDELARLVGTDEYWVVATIPLAALQWVEFGQGNGAGARATIRHRTAWPEGASRTGRVQRLIGEVDQSTRLARAIVSVPDPLGQTGEPSLILGTVVQVDIEATPIENVVRLDRSYLRQNDTVWVMENDLLRIREVDVIFSDSTHAYITTGLESGEKVVTTSLATVVDGLAIREAGDEAGAEESAVTRTEGSGS